MGLTDERNVMRPMEQLEEVRREACDEFIATLEAYPSGDGFEVPVELVYATARH